MKTEIETAIKTLLQQITPTTKALDAMQLTQAAANLAGACSCLASIPQGK